MGPGFGDGMGVLIIFGLFGMAVAALLVVVGVPLGLWWAFHHITIN